MNSHVRSCPHFSEKVRSVLALKSEHEHEGKMRSFMSTGQHWSLGLLSHLFGFQFDVLIHISGSHQNPLDSRRQQSENVGPEDDSNETANQDEDQIADDHDPEF